MALKEFNVGKVKSRAGSIQAPGSCHCVAVVLDLIRAKFDTVRISSRRMLRVGLPSD